MKAIAYYWLTTLIDGPRGNAFYHALIKLGGNVTNLVIHDYQNSPSTDSKEYKLTHQVVEELFINILRICVEVPG